MRLIRLILEYVNGLDEFGDIRPPHLAGYTELEIAYHIRLCGDAGYLVLKKGQQEAHPVIIRMTWCGHKALEDAIAAGQ